MSILSEFRQFAVKGNVIDLAVGVVIGTAFGKIVASLVNDIVMPPIGLMVGGVDFKELKITLKEAVMANGEVVTEAVTVNYGNFIQNLFDFLIIAMAIFAMVKTINAMKRKEEIAPKTPVPTKEELLLAEIRDILKEKK